MNLSARAHELHLTGATHGVHWARTLSHRLREGTEHGYLPYRPSATDGAHGPAESERVHVCSAMHVCSAIMLPQPEWLFDEIQIGTRLSTVRTRSISGHLSTSIAGKIR